MSTTTSDTQTTAISTGEILTTAQLRSETEHAEAVMEEFAAHAAAIGTWTNALGERYVAAPFGTDALSLAVSHVSEAQGVGSAISEALAEINAACDEADSLGEKVQEIQADGLVDSFQVK